MGNGRSGYHVTPFEDTRRNEHKGIRDHLKHSAAQIEMLLNSARELRIKYVRESGIGDVPKSKPNFGCFVDESSLSKITSEEELVTFLTSRLFMVQGIGKLIRTNMKKQGQSSELVCLALVFEQLVMNTLPGLFLLNGILGLKISKSGLQLDLERLEREVRSLLDEETGNFVVDTPTISIYRDVMLLDQFCNGFGFLYQRLRDISNDDFQSRTSHGKRL